MNLCLDVGNKYENSQILKHVDLASSGVIYYNLDKFRYIDYQAKLEKVQKIREKQKKIYQINNFPILCIDHANVTKKTDTFFILNLFDSQLNYFNINQSGLRNFKILIACGFKNLKSKYSNSYPKDSLENSFIYKLDLLIFPNKGEGIGEFGYLIEKYAMTEHDITDFQGVKNLLSSNFFTRDRGLKITKKAKINIIYFYRYLRAENSVNDSLPSPGGSYSRLQVVQLVLRCALTISRIKFQKNIKNADVNEAKDAIMFHRCNVTYCIKNAGAASRATHLPVTVAGARNKSTLLKNFKNNMSRLIIDESVIGASALLKMHRMDARVVDVASVMFRYSKNKLHYY
mmetsp:Transcript_17144/g.34689  ORF Transcript_17144/g.34689 Transcript_17144/m.34689 type:complete len:344 (+) Transcript_17144:108-1139(+)